jgi:hypothetical protein
MERNADREMLASPQGTSRLCVQHFQHHGPAPVADLGLRMHIGVSRLNLLTKGFARNMLQFMKAAALSSGASMLPPRRSSHRSGTRPSDAQRFVDPLFNFSHDFRLLFRFIAISE